MAATTSEQLTALREGAAFCSPDARFLVRAHGKDLLPWLDRLLSLPVADIEQGQCVHATLMDGKGRMRTDLRVLAPGPPAQGLLLDLPLSHRAKLLTLLDMYVITEDVHFEDLSAGLRSASLIGAAAPFVLKTCGFEAPAAQHLSHDGSTFYVLPTMLVSGPGFDLFFDGDLGRDIIERFFEAGAVRVEPGQLNALRVAAGVPWFAEDLSGDIIPLEANLDAKVSIHKGCYPGQEVLARILNLGQVARRLSHLSVAGDQTGGDARQAGAALMTQDGKTAGKLTSVAYDPTADTTFALGYLKRASWDPGSKVLAGEVLLEVLGPSEG